MKKENTLIRWLKSAFRSEGATGMAGAAGMAGAVVAETCTAMPRVAGAEACAPVPHVAHAFYGGGFAMDPHVAHAVYRGGFASVPRMARAACNAPSAEMCAKHDRTGATAACDAGDGTRAGNAVCKVAGGGEAVSCGNGAGAGGNGAAAHGASDGVSASTSASSSAGVGTDADAGSVKAGAGSSSAPASFPQPPSAGSPYAATFRRVEKKYCLDQEQYQKLLAVVKQHMQPDAYPQTVVSSLYYDTPGSALIDRSLEKPLYKEKLRVRSYGALQADGRVRCASDQVFVELKKKYKGVVYKRRLALAPDVAQAFLCEGNLAGAEGAGGADSDACHAGGAGAAAGAGGGNEATSRGNGAGAGGNGAGQQAASALLSYREQQVAREIAAFLGRYDALRPAMITQCVRTAWKQPGSQLRITFDEQLQAGRPAQDAFSFQMAGRPLSLLQPGQVLMEVKQAGGMPLWLVEALSACCIYPQSFSKYGTAYQMACGAGGAHEAARGSARGTTRKPTHKPTRKPTNEREVLHA